MVECSGVMYRIKSLAGGTRLCGFLMAVKWLLFCFLASSKGIVAFNQLRMVFRTIIATFHSFLLFRKKWGTQLQVIICKPASMCLYIPLLSEFLPFASIVLCTLLFHELYRQIKSRHIPYCPRQTPIPLLNSTMALLDST